MKIDYEKLSNDVMRILKREFKGDTGIPSLGIAAGGAIDSAVREALGLVSDEMPTRYKDLDVYYPFFSNQVPDSHQELHSFGDSLRKRSRTSENFVNMNGESTLRGMKLNASNHLSSYLENGFASTIERGQTRIVAVDNDPDNELINRVFLFYSGAGESAELDIIDTFDINCTQAAINLQSKEVFLHDNYINYLYSKELKANPDQPTPIALAYRLLEKHEQFPGTSLNFDDEMARVVSARTLINHVRRDTLFADKSVLGGAIGAQNLNRMLKHGEHILKHWRFEKFSHFDLAGAASTTKELFKPLVESGKIPSSLSDLELLNHAILEINRNRIGNIHEIWQYLKDGWNIPKILAEGERIDQERKQFGEEESLRTDGYFFTRKAKDILSAPENIRKAVALRELLEKIDNSIHLKEGEIDLESTQHSQTSNGVSEILEKATKSRFSKVADQMSAYAEYAKLFSSSKRPKLLARSTETNSEEWVRSMTHNYAQKEIEQFNQAFDSTLTFGDIFERKYTYYKGSPNQPDTALTQLFDSTGIKTSSYVNALIIFDSLNRCAHPKTKSDKRLLEGLERLIDLRTDYNTRTPEQDRMENGPYEYLMAMYLMGDQMKVTSLTKSFYDRFENAFASHTILFNGLLESANSIDVKKFTQLIKNVTYFEKRGLQEIIGAMETGTFTLSTILESEPQELLEAYNKSLLDQYGEIEVDPLFHPFENEHIKADHVSTVGRLKEIGSDLRHCVGGYWEQAKSYTTLIFDIVDKDRANREGRSTLEMRFNIDREGNINFRQIQHRTFCNAEPKESHLLFVEEVRGNLLEQYANNKDAILAKIKQRHPDYHPNRRRYLSDDNLGAIPF